VAACPVLPVHLDSHGGYQAGLTPAGTSTTVELLNQMTMGNGCVSPASQGWGAGLGWRRHRPAALILKGV
jgi:hypothetical protein